ncbi:MAG TPA: response regulator [Thermodesulfobacteriota bacterium]|nr:response regulator [Thermodesulfobacteriota bacterium]
MEKILLVDDETNIRLFYKEVLCEEGYEVLEAESGKESFDILRREPIDLVVLDIKLRSESGLDVLQNLTKEFPNLPVVLCTAYSSFQDDYISWLAEAYIVKSTDTEELVKEIKRVINKKRRAGGDTLITKVEMKKKEDLQIVSKTTYC